MIGIYKITSPSGKVYIGQSRNIRKRFSVYKRKKCENQIRIYNSIMKYGWDNHIFEVIEECEIELLNERERYWQDFYNVIGKNGLNCILTNIISLNQNNLKIKKPKQLNNFLILPKEKEKRSYESRLKTSKSMTGKTKSEETRNKTSQTMIGKKRGPYKKN